MDNVRSTSISPLSEEKAAENSSLNDFEKMIAEDLADVRNIIQKDAKPDAIDADGICTGNVYLSYGNEIMVLAEDNSTVILADLQRHKIFRKSRIDLRIAIADEKMVFVRVNDSKPVINIPDKEMGRVASLRNAMELVLCSAYPRWELLFKKHGDSSYLAIADTVGMSRKQFRILLKKYLLSGRDETVLINKKYIQTARQRADDAPTKYNDTGEPYTVKEVREQLMKGKARYMQTHSAKAAYDWMLKIYYPARVQLMNSSTTHTAAAAARSGIISYVTFTRFLNGNLAGMSVYEYSHGEKRKNSRSGSGNAQYHVDYPGQLLLVDETELDIYIVDIDSDGTLNIVKPIMYLGADALTTAITAWYIGIENNSFDGLRNMMLSMLEPHEEQTKKYGVHCTPDEFPSMYMPLSIASDHGSEYEGTEFGRAARQANINIKLDGLGFPEEKGIIEEAHARIQKYIHDEVTKKNGYILHNDPRGVDKAVKDAKANACLQLHELRAIVARAIIECNREYLARSQPDKEQMELGIPMTPMARWKYYTEKTGAVSAVTDANYMRYAYAFLRSSRKFRICDSGIEYTRNNTHLYYYSDEDWFAKMLSDKTHRTRYAERVKNAATVDYVYIVYENQVHRVSLAVRRKQQETFRGMSWDRYDELADAYNKDVIFVQKTHDMATKASTRQEISETVKYAQARHQGMTNNTEDLKNSRRKLQMNIKEDPTETSARVISTAFGDPDMVDGEASVIGNTAGSISMAASLSARDSAGKNTVDLNTSGEGPSSQERFDKRAPSESQKTPSSNLTMEELAALFDSDYV